MSSLGGIFSGMKSYPDSEQVLDDLGDKVNDAFVESIAAARNDLAKYRDAFPAWAAEHRPRGWANWIHDRIWAHLEANLEDVGHTHLVEKGPTREILIEGTEYTYRMRVKRHDLAGHVRTYPTQGALEFLDQPPTQLVLEGLALVHLIAGYQWEAESHQIGPVVLSLRDGANNVIWLIELEEPVSPRGVVEMKGSSLPARPQVKLPFDDTDASAAGQR